MSRKVLLKRGGASIVLRHAADIQRHIANGWVVDERSPEQVEAQLDERAKAKSKVKVQPEPEPKSEVVPESEVMPDELAHVLQELNLASPELLAEIPDEEILDVKGIGPAALKKIRNVIPAA